MTEERLKEIEARAAAATEGPWYEAWYERYNASGDEMHCGGIRSRTARLLKYPMIDKVIIRQEDWYGAPLKPDMEFIAHARQDIPDLVAALREARQLLGALANVGPSVIEFRPHEQQWLCCFGPFAFEGIEPVGHKTDCPWLLAKQYLEPPQP